MGIPLFGVNKETNSEKVLLDNETQVKIAALQSEIMQAHKKLEDSESKLAELQNKLEEYRQKEIHIAEIMINAQISAQKVEAQARAKAEMLLQATDEELRRKNQELELLRLKVQMFKQDINERLNQYKISLENTMDPDEDFAFTPTIVTKEKKVEQKLIG